MQNIVSSNINKMPYIRKRDDKVYLTKKERRVLLENGINPKDFKGKKPIK